MLPKHPPKPDLHPNLSLPPVSSPLLNWQGCSFPINWQYFFNVTDLRLHLEIGFGDGRYTISRALETPLAQFVGLEISNTSIQKALKQIKKGRLQNIYILKVSAEFAVRQLFTTKSLTSITINFPDPWPKKKHKQNRLLKSSFFELAANRLKPQGQIYLATDHYEYFTFAKEEAESTGLYKLKKSTAPEAVFKTKYALKWQKQGKPLYYQVFKCQQMPIKDYPILTRNGEMPHAILQGKLPKKTPFKKQVSTYATGHVILHEVSRSWNTTENNRLLVRATVDEPDLRQQILVVVKERSEAEVLVGLESFGDPIITKTARGAVHSVTEWLLSLKQGLTVTKRNY